MAVGFVIWSVYLYYVSRSLYRPANHTSSLTSFFPKACLTQFMPQTLVLQLLVILRNQSEFSALVFNKTNAAVYVYQWYIGAALRLALVLQCAAAFNFFRLFLIQLQVARDFRKVMLAAGFESARVKKIGEMTFQRWVEYVFLPLKFSFDYSRKSGGVKVLHDIPYAKSKPAVLKSNILSKERAKNVSAPWQFKMDKMLENVKKNVFEVGSNQMLDVAVYRDAKNCLDGDRIKCILFIHGGAFVLGSKEMSTRQTLDLVRAGYVICSVNYRLAPKHNMMQIVDDVKKSVIFIKNNLPNILSTMAKESEQELYLGKRVDICVMGESAGGYLALMTALTMNNVDYQIEADLKDIACFGGDNNYEYLQKLDLDTSVVGCVDLFGIKDFVAAADHEGKFLPDDFMNWMRHKAFVTENAAEKSNIEKFSPLRILDKMIGISPPILSTHGTHDTLIQFSQATNFVAKLATLRGEAKVKPSKQASNDVFLPVSYGRHAFIMFSNPMSFATSDVLLLFVERCFEAVSKKEDNHKIKENLKKKLDL